MPAVIFERVFLLAEVEIPVKMVSAGFRGRRVPVPTETKEPPAPNRIGFSIARRI